MMTPQIRSLLEQQEERKRQARIDKMVEQHIADAKDPLVTLTERFDALEAKLEEQAQTMLKLMRQYDPTSKDHEWASVDETQNIPRCTCVTWRDWKSGELMRKPNGFCFFPHRA